MIYILLVSTDVLTNNLIEEALAQDQKENVNKPPSQRTSKHLDSLKVAINSCSVSFNVWEKKNADGKGSGCYDFTSLMGSDKKILLKELPKVAQHFKARNQRCCDKNLDGNIILV